MSKRVFQLVGFVVIILLTTWAATAQQSAPSPETNKAGNRDVGNDDILILVNIKADSLKFDAVPNTRVDFPGTHMRNNVWITDRQNLPEQVEQGVTYRNIGLQLRISTRFTEIERILREILADDTVENVTQTSDGVGSPVGNTSRARAVSPEDTAPASTLNRRRPQRR